MANLSKIKREKMLDYLEKLKEITGDDENIRAITEIYFYSRSIYCKHEGALGVSSCFFTLFVVK